MASNFKAQPVEVHITDESTVMRFEIPGLREIMAGTFELSGVMPIQVRFDRIIEMLEETGIDKSSAEDYVDEFAEMVTQREIAKLLARRMKRVG